MKQNRVLMILGMHRSGTSLVSQWLSSCGLNLGETFLQADYANKKGYHEDVDFLNLHKEILTSQNFHNSGLFGELDKVKCPPNFLIKIKELIKKKSSNNHQWGWKDPRTTLFLYEYEKSISNLKYIIVFRKCNSVVDSLLKRDYNHRIERYKKQGFIGKIKRFVKVDTNTRIKKRILKNTDQYVKSWIFYNQSILEHIKCIDNDRYLILDMDRIISSSDTICTKLDEWGFEINYYPINKVFNSNLVHSKELKILEEPVYNNTIKEIEDEFAKLSL